MRGLKDVGADGAFVGLPLWQTPTIKNAGNFWAHLAEAVPDMPLMIYANAYFFKTTFPTAFWRQVGERGKTAVVTKIAYNIQNLIQDSIAAPQVNFMAGVYNAYRMTRGTPHQITTIWSSGSAGMGPEPYVALADAILRDDEQRVAEIQKDISSLPPLFAPAPQGLAELNAQVNRYAANVAGYLKPSSTRVPYLLEDMTESTTKQAEEHAKAYAELRKKYAKTPVS